MKVKLFVDTVVQPDSTCARVHFRHFVQRVLKEHSLQRTLVKNEVIKVGGHNVKVLRSRCEFGNQEG